MSYFMLSYNVGLFQNTSFFDVGSKEDQMIKKQTIDLKS